MENVITLIVRTITQAPIFLGLVALVGLLLQKKKFSEVMEGVVKTIVGMSMLSAGSGLLTSTLTPLILLLNEVTGVTGVVPQNFAVFGEVMNEYSISVVSTFIIGFLLNLLLVKIVPWKNAKNVYLTVHVSLILCSFLVISVSAIMGTPVISISTIVVSAIFLGLYNTFSPMIPRYLFKRWTNDLFTLGHNQQIGTFFAVKLAQLVGNPEDDAEKINLPKGLSIFKDTTISLAVLMPAIFIGIGLTVGKTHIESLSGSTQWIVWLFLQGITFTAGFSILLSGVRMFIAQILPAFKGISEKIVPNSIPALDCAVFYTYSPTGAMLGFLGSLIGALAAMIVTILFQLPIVVFPSPNIVFFDGCLLGVFANKHGGWKGALFSTIIIGFFVHILIMFLYPLTGEFYGTGTTYSQTDYSLFWMPVIQIFKVIFGLFS